MRINGKEITAKKFAFDGCHKIYLLDTTAQATEARLSGYRIHSIAKLKEAYNGSCGLKFISDWALESYVSQFEEAIFT